MSVDIQKRNQRQNKWQKENTDRINFTMPKGMKSRIAEAAQSAGVGSAEFIRQAISEKIARESPQDAITEKMSRDSDSKGNVV